MEGEDFENNLKAIMQERKINKFDVVNCLALLAHIKNPIKLFQIIKKYCSENCMIFIRNIDDGFNVTYGCKNIEKGLSF